MPFNQKQGNIGEYLKSIMALNNWYSGLAASCGVGFGGTSGLDYLTQSQIGLNAAKASDAGEQEKTLSGGYEAQQRISTSEDPGANQVICTMDNYSGARHLVKKSGHEWYMKGDGGGRFDGRSQTTTYSDGTTVTSSYDKDGNVINNTVGYDASADNHIQNTSGGGTAGANANIALPSYEAFFNSYPLQEDCKTQMSVPEVCAMIGGQVNQFYKSNSSSFAGACALRVSIALNKSGAKIPAIAGTMKGADGENYFLSAAKMHSWMLKTFGKPDISLSRKGFNDVLNEGKLNGNSGIYFMVPISQSGFGASGHATLYNGSTCSGSCFIEDAGKIDLWILK